MNIENTLRESNQWIDEKLSTIYIPSDLLDLVKEDVALQYQILPYEYHEDTGIVVLVTHNLENAKLIHILEKRIGKSIKLLFAHVDNVKDGLIHHYNLKDGIVGNSGNQLILKKREDEDDEIEDVRDIQNGATSPFIAKVNNIILDALREGASDIHILPVDSQSIIYFRIDGDLEDFSHVYKIQGKREKIKIVNRFKLLCDPALDITKRDIEQKGSFKFTYNDRDINCRVSILPTIRGEKVVVRILDSSGELRDLNSLGFFSEDIANFKKCLYESYGLNIVAGPTGSGKTTTNYAAVKFCWDHNPKVNISTIEDPPEYFVPRYAQILVSEPEQFDQMLEALLRQDPDIMIIGEIRNERTAQNVLRASQTGHKVFTTLHATDCIVAMDRLFSMNIPRRELLAQLSCVISQRLLKINCLECSVEQRDFPEELITQLTPDELKFIQSGTPKMGKGCQRCNQKGYDGRMAVAEFLFFDNEVRDFFAVEHSLLETARFLKKIGFKTMWEKGLQLVAEGKVSLDNMVRVLSKRQL
jgi:type IV pilus assembly protein PilB